MDSQLVLRQSDLDELAELGRAMVDSGLFGDVHKVAQASMKVLAGRELGLNPVESMRALHIVEGKVELSADLLAQRVKQHPDYDYRVRRLERDGCRIEFFQNGESLGVSSFDDEDRKAAGLSLTTSSGKPSTWGKFPRNMFFARAMSNGVAFFCPDVAGGGRLYAEGEIDQDREPNIIEFEGGVVDIDTGEIVDVEIVEEGTTGEVLETANPALDSADEDKVRPDGMVPGEIPGPAAAETRAAPPRETPSGHLPRVETAPMATVPQLKKLAILAGEFGWDDQTRRDNAGVASFKDLTKARASELIEDWSSVDTYPQQWSSIETSLGEGSGSTDPEGISVSAASEGAVEDAGNPEEEPYGEGGDPSGGPADDLITVSGPPNEALVQRAQTKWGTRARVLGQVRKHYPQVSVFEEITHDQLADVLTKALEA